MVTLWLGGGGVDCPTFYTDNRRGYRISWRGGFHKHPPPWTLSAWRHPPSVKLKNTPLPPLLLPKKRTAAAQKTELPKSWGPPLPPPRLIRLCTGPSGWLSNKVCTAITLFILSFTTNKYLYLSIVPTLWNAPLSSLKPDHPYSRYTWLPLSSWFNGL